MTSASTKATPAMPEKKASTVSAPVTSWPARVQELAADPKLDLAPLLGGDPELRDGRWQLHPYLVRRDVTALIGWAEQLEEFPQSAHLAPLPFEGLTVPVTQISVIGVLLGEVVDPPDSSRGLADTAERAFALEGAMDGALESALQLPSS